MKVLRLHATRDLRMHEEPIPSPGVGEALIRIGSVGVCASDIHWWRDGHIGTTYISDPLVLGHEASGIVEAVGDGVTNVKVGQRVAIEPARSCMKCEYCLSGNYNVCPNVMFFGTPPTDGCLREYVTWPALLLLPVPDSISLDEAAMLEPLAVGIFAVELAKAQPGETAAILGAGAIGLSVLQPLKLAGADKVLVSDPVPERRKLAEELGADFSCSPDDIIKASSEITGGRGFKIVFECAGETSAVREASRIAGILGRVVVVGIPEEDEYPFEAGSARRKQLNTVFVRRSNLTTEKAIELVENSAINVSSFASHVFSLEEASKAFELAESRTNGIIRAIIRVSGGY